MLKAVIFDFDGILVDTEPFHYQSFLETMTPLGFRFAWQDYKANYLGLDDRDVVRAMFKAENRTLSPEQLSTLTTEKAGSFSRLVETSNLTPYPGVVELIKTLANQIPVGLCSGSVRTDILPVLRRFELYSYFSIIVTADDVPKSKPDPASYQLAVQRLQEKFPARELCQDTVVAIEDSPAGIASATGAGLKVIAVTNNYPADKLQSATHILDSLNNYESCPLLAP